MQNHSSSFYLIDDCCQKVSKNCSVQGMFHCLRHTWGLGSEYHAITRRFKPQCSSDFPLTPCWRLKPALPRLSTHWHPSFESSQRYSWQFRSSAIWHRVYFLDYLQNGDSKFVKKWYFYNVLHGLIPPNTGIFKNIAVRTSHLRKHLIQPQCTPPSPLSIIPSSIGVLSHADFNSKLQAHKIWSHPTTEKLQIFGGKKSWSPPSIWPFYASGLCATCTVASRLLKHT